MKVHAWNLRIVGVDATRHKIRVIDLPGRRSRLTQGQVNSLHQYPRIVAIVAYDEPTEQYQPQALYTLEVNGVVQPGGGQSSAAVKARPDRF